MPLRNELKIKQIRPCYIIYFLYSGDTLPYYSGNLSGSISSGGTMSRGYFVRFPAADVSRNSTQLVFTTPDFNWQWAHLLKARRSQLTMSCLLSLKPPQHTPSNATLDRPGLKCSCCCLSCVYTDTTCGLI